MDRSGTLFIPLFLAALVLGQTLGPALGSLPARWEAMRFERAALGPAALTAPQARVPDKPNPPVVTWDGQDPYDCFCGAN